MTANCKEMGAYKPTGHLTCGLLPIVVLMAPIKSVLLQQENGHLTRIKLCLQLISVAFEHCVLHVQDIYQVCMAHKLQCKTPHFPKHKFPVHECSNTPDINCISR